MKKSALILLITVSVSLFTGIAQTNSDNSKIDLLLIRGEYKKVIDTCQVILSTDSLNADLLFKMGLAYQNLIADDKALDCFLKASEISPANNGYNFMVAKTYYNRGKSNLAKPLLQKICAADSMNWSYSYYLTSILMQEGKYDESIQIYKRFYKQDPNNYVLTDKIGFASLRKGDSEYAIEMFDKSLALNNKNVSALKNLSYLYATSYRIDTAIALLSRGMEIDPSDIDLYVRRAAIHFSINYNKRALLDYLKILSMGDSTVLYLKRAGIGYTNNLQPKEAIPYLLKAFQKDTTDAETCAFLAKNYEKLNDHKNSAFFYKHIIQLYTPFAFQLSINYYLLAEVYKADGKYQDAINSYLLGQKLGSDINTTMIIANVYDEKLNDVPKAIYYYELYLKSMKDAKMKVRPEYAESINRRLEYLKNPPPSNK